MHKQNGIRNTNVYELVCIEILQTYQLIISDTP